MTEMNPEISRPYGVSIQAVEYVRNTSEPGQIFYTNLPRYLDGGMSPDDMLDDVERQHGIRLSTVARSALGGWAIEESNRHNNQQAATQGES